MNTLVLSFHSSKVFYIVLSGYKTIVVARLVSDGEILCTVGCLSEIYHQSKDLLDGRILQVVDDFSISRSPNKIRYFQAKQGVVLAAIIDKYLPGDGQLNSLLEVVESDSE